MLTKRALLKYSFLVLGLTSCYNNQIYFDNQDGSIKTCNQKVIRILNVEDTKELNVFQVRKKEKMKGSNKLNLTKLNADYRSYSLSGGELYISFELAPNTAYEITNRTYGDAADGKLKIWTDKNGKIIKSDKNSCD